MMPYFCSQGDYDALLVLMMLPRMSFKAELVINQLRQHHKLDEALGSLSSVSPSRADQLAFVCTLIYKLTTLNMMVNRADRLGSGPGVGVVLCTCLCVQDIEGV